MEAMDGFADPERQAHLTGLRWLEGQKLEFWEASHGGGTLFDVRRRSGKSHHASRNHTYQAAVRLKAFIHSPACRRRSGEPCHGLMVCRKENDK